MESPTRHMDRPTLKERSTEDLCAFGTVMKKCYFCDQPRTILTNEHYTFCPNCTALYTFMLVQKSNCEHIKDGVPRILHVPNYPYTIDKPYIYEGYEEEGHAIFDRCSVCHTNCHADGW